MSTPVVIDYKPPPTVKEFIRDFKPGQLFYDWIVGPVGCLPADSEFLTPDGWRRMDAYRPGDKVAVYDRTTGAVGFEAAQHMAVPATEPFYRFDSGSLEMELSPEHTVLYTDYHGVSQVATAQRCAEKPSRRMIPTTFRLDAPDAPVGDAEIRLRVAFSADGHIPDAGRKVSFTLRKERKKARLRRLLDDMGLDWSEKTQARRPTETRFAFVWGRADKDLDFVWGLSSRQLGIVLDECTYWDGLADHEERRYYTTVARHADAIQFAAHATGLRATIHETDDPRGDGRWKTMYTVAIRAADNPKNRAAIREHTRVTRVEAVDGLKYCFTTSTGFFVARCNGSVFVTGNSGKTTGIFMKLARMAQLQAPSQDGVRRTRAVIVRNTFPQLRDTTLASWNIWFQDGVAGEWIASQSKFILRFGDVECEVLFRALDTQADIARVLSLEVTFAIIDEFVQIPREIIDALSARCGRYPSAKDGGATNWGMWGSSNPDTEDNWWFDYLHNNPSIAKFGKTLDDEDAEEMRRRFIKAGFGNEEGDGEPSEPIGTYFVQPSGFAPDAENIDNLPGKAGYYRNQAKGKTPQWIKQFIDAEWGYSASGTPVIPSFRKDIHIAKSPLKFNPNAPLIVGLDPGLQGSAMIIGQENAHGQLNVLGELIQSGYGAERLITQRLKPYLRFRFPNLNLNNVLIAPDPAASNRSQSDEKTVVQVFAKHFRVVGESNNRLPLRLDAINWFTSRLTDAGPALQIDPYECPTLIRALVGGWRFEKAKKHDGLAKPVPEDNNYTHPGDAFGYLCRFFHRRSQRELRYSGASGSFRPPRQFGAPYHVR